MHPPPLRSSQPAGAQREICTLKHHPQMSTSSSIQAHPETAAALASVAPPTPPPPPPATEEFSNSTNNSIDDDDGASDDNANSHTDNDIDSNTNNNCYNNRCNYRNNNNNNNNNSSSSTSDGVGQNQEYCPIAATPLSTMDGAHDDLDEPAQQQTKNEVGSGNVIYTPASTVSSSKADSTYEGEDGNSGQPAESNSNSNSNSNNNSNSNSNSNSSSSSSSSNSNSNNNNGSGSRGAQEWWKAEELAAQVGGLNKELIELKAMIEKQAFDDEASVSIPSVHVLVC